MRLTTPGKLLLEEAIPDKYLPKGKALTEKVIKGIFTEIARKEPERYSDIMGKLTDVSKEAVYRYGRMASIGLKDLEIPPELARYREKVRQEVNKIIESDSLTGAEKNKAIVQYLYKKMSEIPEKVVEAAKNMNSGFYAQVESGARGNKNQLMQVIFGDTLLIDAEDRPVPIPVLHSYGEGVKPMEYWAASSGARKGSISVQFSTADGGYLGKQLNNIGHRLVVTERDCGTKNGIPVDANDEDNIGSVLAMPVGKIPAGTVITPEILPKLGDGKIRVRSLATCALGDGVCAICSGIRERGDFPAIGDTVGIVGARAMSEPITQAGLKCLHPDTLVRMADWSIKPIKDIVVGDIVLGADIKGNCFPSKVINVFDNGIQPMYTTEYKAGLSIKNKVSLISTLEHKLLQVTNKSGCSEELYNGVPRILKADHSGNRTSAVFPCAINPVSGIINEPAAFMLGLLCGDGCYTKGVKYKVFLSCADDVLIEDLKDYLATFNTKLSFHKGSKCYWSVVNITTYNGDNTKNFFKELLTKYDMIGKYAYEKVVPNTFNAWDKESQLAFISGLMSADGHIRVSPNGCRVMLGLTSLELIRSVSDILFKWCGVLPPHIMIRSKDRKHTLYTISYNRSIDVYRILSALSLKGIKEQTRSIAINLLSKELEGSYMCLSFGKRLSQTFFGNTQALDIEVDNADHLFVLANGLIVSNSKHSGGVAGTDDKNVSGFEELNQFIQVPSTFKGAATISEIDGTVLGVKEAPAGGQFVFVNDKRFYVPRGREVIVKKGDSVTAGDMLSDGTPNPAELVKYKGVGEGRRYFIDKYRELLKKNGAAVHRRNIEAVARGFINRVKMDSPDGYNGYMIDDIVPYDELAVDYEPRAGSKLLGPNQAKNMYLEQPVLHYTIGTRITPQVIKDLNSNKISNIVVNEQQPVFSPFVVRARSIMETDPDWMTRMAGENLKRSTLEAARMGAKSTTEGTSYFPAAANPVGLDTYKGGTPDRSLHKTFTQVR